jgi:hypothetical protein
MLSPGDAEKNAHNMVMSFAPEIAGTLATLGSAVGCGSVAANPAASRGSSSPRGRAVAEAVITRTVMDKLRPELEAVEMWKSFEGRSAPWRDRSGFPDGTFSNQIYQFEYILEGFGMENLLWPFLECITAVWYILGLFGNLVAS